MYCPKCGSPLEPGDDYCMSCGARILRDRTYGHAQDRVPGAGGDVPKPFASEGLPHKVSIAVAVAIAVLMIAVFANYVGGGGDTFDRSFSVGALEVDGSLYSVGIEVESDGSSGSLTYESDGVVTWQWKDVCASYYVEVDGSYVERQFTIEEADTLQFDRPGMYEVALFVDGAEVGRGMVVLDGGIKDTYQWSRTVDGEMHGYSVSLSYRFSDFLEYFEDDAVRSEDGGLAAARFAVVDDVILDLAQALSEKYAEVYGATAPQDGQDYADYLLSFVQCVIQYPQGINIGDDGEYHVDSAGYGDTFMHGVAEYWAYPLETLYNHMGDCEDTSFLLCALYSASGYTSAILTVSGHMLVAVEVEGFEWDPRYAGAYAHKSYKVQGYATPFYPCETTFDAAVPAGYFSKEIEDDMDSPYVQIVRPYGSTAVAMSLA